MTQCHHPPPQSGQPRRAQGSPLEELSLGSAHFRVPEFRWNETKGERLPSGHRLLEEGSPVNTVKAMVILCLLLNLTIKLNHNSLKYSLLGRCPVDINNTNSGENQLPPRFGKSPLKRKHMSPAFLSCCLQPRASL